MNASPFQFPAGKRAEVATNHYIFNPFGGMLYYGFVVQDCCWFDMLCKYNSSTFLRAHSVFLKKVKLDFMDGLLLKQLMLKVPMEF